MDEQQDLGFVGLLLKMPTNDRRSLRLDAPEWFRVGKNTPACHIHNVAAGKHPFGGPLGPPDSRCRTCAHKRTSVTRAAYYSGRRFWKCDKHRPWTSGLASDLRLRWRGCHLWELDEGVDLPEAERTGD